MFGTLPVEIVHLILEYVDFIDLLHLQRLTQVPLFDVIKGRALTFRSKYKGVTDTLMMRMHAVQRTMQFFNEGDRSIYYISKITMRGCDPDNCRSFRKLQSFLAGEQRYTAAKLRFH